MMNDLGGFAAESKPNRSASLDPMDWTDLRALGHRMMDDMIDRLAGAADGPVWRPMPDQVRATLRGDLTPAASAAAAYEEFQELVAPYATGNTHPRFNGWVHGGGNAVGMLADLLAAGLNANLGGRDHAPIEVERQVIRWSAAMLGLPPETSGLLVTGTSIANFIAVLVARTQAIGPAVRRDGIGGARLTAYCSAGAHACLPRAMDMAGFGADALRMVATTPDRRVDLAALADAVARDRASGARPFLVAGTAGSVDTGAIDDLAALAAFCRDEGLWFHVDAAFGAFAACSPRLRPLLAGIEQADSVAFDFHKLGQVPYDAGCILVRDPAALLAAFAQDAAYLRSEAQGLAGNAPWPCDLGPDLSRGFRALKVWMTLKVHGADGLGRVAEQCCAVAKALATRIAEEPALELLAPVPLNIVCFRSPEASDTATRALVVDLQESGVAAPSTTVIDGRLAIRAAIVNHRTTVADADILVDAVLARLRA